MEHGAQKAVLNSFLLLVSAPNIVGYRLASNVLEVVMKAQTE